MLGAAEAAAALPAGNMERAKQFYSGTLGLKIVKDTNGGVLFEAGGGSKIFVYQSEFAGTNKATAAGWVSDDVESIATALKSKGVTLEHYDRIPGVTREGDIHVMGDLKAIWFKDTEGNILSVSNSMG
jgi:catechol 2,3-dioxygenase-like lactoylglutathione lyase family enzyme